MIRSSLLLVLLLFPLLLEAKIVIKSVGKPGQTFTFKLEKKQQVYIETMGNIDVSVTLSGPETSLVMDEDEDESGNESFSELLPAGEFSVSVISSEQGTYKLRIYSKNIESELPFKSETSVVKIIPNGDDNKVHLKGDIERVVEFETGSGYAVIETHGDVDTQIALYKVTSRGEKIKLATDEDSGDGLNAKIEKKIRKGKYRVTIKSNSENTDEIVILNVLVDQPKCRGQYLVGQTWKEKISAGERVFKCKEIDGKPKAELQSITCAPNHKEISGICETQLCDNKYRMGENWKVKIEGGYKEYLCQDAGRARRKLVKFICRDDYEKKGDSCKKRSAPLCDGQRKIGERWQEAVPGGAKL